MHLNPEAHFDCLLIASELDAPLGGVTRLELQRIAFLSCLLSIYTKQAVSDWGYRFANTGTGLPFSNHLVTATDYLVATDMLSETEGRLRPTEFGMHMLEYLRALQSMTPRIPCVSAAAASLLAVPGSVMAEGLQQEPTTVASKLRNSPTMLLDEPHLLTLHQHFAALASVVPPGQKDLLSPSVLWLKYMAHVGENREQGGEDPSGPKGPEGPDMSGGPSWHDGGGGEAYGHDNAGIAVSTDATLPVAAANDESGQGTACESECEVEAQGS